MRHILIGTIAALLSLSAQARPTADAADISRYDFMIRAAWPHVDLRPDQRQWLATRSAIALKQCQSAGRTQTHCRMQVREGLREALGSEPIAAGLASRSH
ncbi:hypothetical protein ATO7_05645 [Oceanococcus atlanticus]|uniref:UrcA family protein n=1 Tax=Oceanococcus atlanticus TaxID=1317117 RepID=A0A1Y1SID0_9GAMM|nr:hypothetical protein [Oceanococcus atlanticus]ORE89338.1 hypothetical protein ATO7_05645 [Oceanococcus atlanticus]RZO85012.1 MAG: hypothetical protein EVA65_08355 [Oceanococcus sp.]